MMAIGRKPLFGPFCFGTEASHCQPEFLGMVGDSKMHRFVRYEVSENCFRRHNQTPVE